MSEPAATFRSSFPANRAAPSVARHALSEFLHTHGADPRALADVLLALSEVVTNSVVHGYRDRAGGEVAIEAEHWSGRLTLSVADSGGGMAPRPDSPGLGLGLPLVGRIAQSVDITARAGGGTLVSMCFTLDGPAR
ncbi:MAG TPA: ATP-binding protein [Solirubrobacteraceae bacterium]|nr:ATP-binding protein [Solirubrobacteraceae bacterium]